MAATAPKLRPLVGAPLPRIAPPTPLRSQWQEYRDLSKKIGIELYPWQETAARYLTALSKDKRWLYPEAAIIVGRQNGKTTLLLPLIIGRLLDGKRIMHTAQNRELPREIHDEVGRLLLEHFSDSLPDKRGIRYGAGQEEIRLRNGGRYRIVAPTRGGARGPSNDLVIIDELREMVSHEFIGAAEPTLSASPNPQMVYLSNAGTETSVVLNGLKQRAGEDPALAYLEWSAQAEREADDVEGWLEANPAIGHMPGKLEYLERKYNSYRIENQLAIYETEHLCRWVISMQTPLVLMEAWHKLQAELEKPLRPIMGIKMHDGKRASAVISWKQSDQTVAAALVHEAYGDPIDTALLGKELKQLAMRLGVTEVVYDPWTDADLARHFNSPGMTVKPLISRDYANASENFARLVESGKLRWSDPEGHLSKDLTWTARRPHESGAWMAVAAKEDRPVTASLAAVRATWLASGPRKGLPQVF